ncbi:hypothetical protein ZWY2020_044460 [Hordeum vulgare]|nr:hypothetical protein ZWY2020_044460 [Hordeum vulgare]
MATPPEPSPSPVRLRLVFDKTRLLRRAQRDLRRCWLLLRPELATVADLSAHVAARFRLHRSCPGGVVLTMDGFALPPFESTCIFRDKDIIRVKQKTCNRMVHHDDVHCIEDPEKVEMRPLPTDDKILAIEYQIDGGKHQEEEVHCDHQPEENVTSNHNLENGHTSSKRKRKDEDARIPESSRRKKLKKVKDIGCSKVDNICQDQGCHGSKESKPSIIGIEEKKAAIQTECTVELDGKQKTARCNQTELSCETEMAGQTTQIPKTSRSARRKKIKRQLRKQEKEKLKENVDCQKSPTAADCPSSSNHDDLPCPSSNENGPHLPFSRHEAEEEESDTSEDIVPVVVRPGHIRFEPAGEPNTSSAKETQANVTWGGTMSKKKGQKWGMNNSNKKSANVENLGKIVGSNTEVNHLMVDRRDEENVFSGVTNQKVNEINHDLLAMEKSVAEEGKPTSGSLDFDTMYPLTRLPMEGDLIAYRLVTLSSSWCPEISSYRVGKVLLYDLISSRIILLPVPEHPIITEEMTCEDESDTMMVDTSPYKEDGSLEIEYSSLLDVRLVKGSEPVSADLSAHTRETGKEGKPPPVGEPVTLDENKGKVHSQNGTSVPASGKDPEAPPGMFIDENKGKVHSQNGTSVPDSGKDPEAPPEEKVHNDKAWEASSEVPNGKPDDEAEGNNGWGAWKQNASTSAWSYRAQRSSALGPTLALLRGKNGRGGGGRGGGGRGGGGWGGGGRGGKPTNWKYGK